MRKSISLLIVFLIGACGFATVAQNSSNAFHEAQKLRSELSQLKDREAEIKIRLQELDHDLKPENIARHFAGVGSVHPEELRETRRKQLQLEKDRLLGQLSEIDQSRSRLESEISLTEARAFQQSALGATSLRPPQSRLAPFMTATVFRIGALTFALIVVGIVLVMAQRRQQGKTNRK